MALIKNILLTACFPIILYIFIISTSGAFILRNDMDSVGQKTERLTQFEIDVIFRRDANEDVKALDVQKALYACCTLFGNDIEMIKKVSDHFKANTYQDIDQYGIIIQENERHYVIHFWGRYKEENQFFENGTWHPNVDDRGAVSEYGYIVDRQTLEIISFVEVP